MTNLILGLVPGSPVIGANIASFAILYNGELITFSGDLLIMRG